MLEKKIQINKNYKQLIGLKYFVINKNYEKKTYDYKKINNYDFLVMLGGGVGYENYFRNIIIFLNKYYIDFKIKIIVGPGVSLKLINFINKFLPNVEIVKFINYPEIYFKKAKIGIIGGGYSKYEVAYFNLPSIIIPVQEHQKSISKVFCNKGCGLYHDVENSSDKKLKLKIDTLLFDSKKYKNMKILQKKLIDGKALERIMRYID